MNERNFQFILLFSFIYFLLCYSLAIDWYENSYFSVLDIFFDSDPNFNLNSFSHGWGRRAITHPLLEFLTVPVRIVEIIYSSFFVITDRLHFRELLALSVSPVFSSLTLIFIYKTLIILDIKPLDASIFTSIFAVSFTNIIFAVIPESYAISCFFVSLLIFYFFKNERLKESGNSVFWFSIAVFLSGTTVTNICIFYLVFFIHLLKNEQLSWVDAATKSLLYSISAFSIVIIFYKVSPFLLSHEAGNIATPEWIKKFVSSSLRDSGRNTVNFFSASLNGFVGVFPETRVNVFCKNFSCNSIYFTRYKSDFFLLISVALFWLAFFFQSIKFFLKKEWKNLYLICGLIITFNFTLHILFGTEMFLYTQHWITPLFLLLIPLLQNRRFISISLLIILIVININFLYGVDQLIASTKQ